MAVIDFTTKPPTEPLDYHTAFQFFDAICDASGDLEGTLAIMSKLIDADCDVNADTVVTLERHLKSDFAALIAACSDARAAILTPLHAAAHPDRPPMGEVADAGDQP